jgi:hypothetical protein
VASSTGGSPRVTEYRQKKRRKYKETENITKEGMQREAERKM